MLLALGTFGSDLHPRATNRRKGAGKSQCHAEVLVERQPRPIRLGWAEAGECGDCDAARTRAVPFPAQAGYFNR